MTGTTHQSHDYHMTTLPPFLPITLSLSSLHLPPSSIPQERIIDFLLAGKAVATTAIYYMMLSRLTRYERLNKPPPRVPLGRMKKSKSYTPGQNTTEADLMAAHVDAGRVPVQRVS